MILPSKSRKREGKEIPSWVIVLAVLITAVATGLLATKTRPERWPGQVSELPRQMTQVTAPVLGATDRLEGFAAPRAIPMAPRIDSPRIDSPRIDSPDLGNSGGFQQVAMQGVPVILWTSPRPHGDRGPCTPCHNVVQNNGAPVPAIHSNDPMPHGFRGMCINCHVTMPAIGFAGMGAQVAAIGQVPGAPLIKDADWMGMEVAPITPLTAQQFAIATGIAGAVVTEVEGKAKAAGIQAGDVVVAINGQAVNDMAGFVAAKRGNQQGGTVQILRRGRFMEATVSNLPPAQTMVAPGLPGQNMMATAPTPPGLFAPSPTVRVDEQRLVAPAPTPVQQGPVRIGLQQPVPPGRMDTPMGERN